MNASNSISISSLLIASSLVLITLIFSYWQKLKLERETVISVVRAILQLVAVGYVLEYVFGLQNPLFTTLLLVFMTFNAAYNAAKRGKGIKKRVFHIVCRHYSGDGRHAGRPGLLQSPEIRSLPDYSGRRDDHQQCNGRAGTVLQAIDL